MREINVVRVVVCRILTKEEITLDAEMGVGAGVYER